MEIRNAFPSPCGDVVLKFGYFLFIEMEDFKSFRPLAGMWF